VPTNALHLLEYRLAEAGHPTAGFVLLIPHYLADTEYPLAAVSALESISAATGLIFPTDRCAKRTASSCRRSTTRCRRTANCNAWSERSRSGTTLHGGERAAVPAGDEDGEVPRGDTIAAELERFLAERTDD
jgi:hypothetical protein